MIVFARVGWEADDYAAWTARMLAAQQAFVTPTTHRGRVCTRLAIVNPTTTVDDLRLVVDSLA